MPWGVVAAAAVSAAGSYLSQKSAAKKQKKAAEDEAQARKDLLEQQHKYDLEDRAYRQQAAGNWAKFANPNFIPMSQPGQATPVPEPNPTPPQHIQAGPYNSWRDIQG